MSQLLGSLEDYAPEHRSDGSPMRNSTAEEIMVYRDQQELANQDCGCLPINYYAMTEMMTFTFHSLHMDFASRDFQSHSRDEKIRAFQATREGSAFADLIRSILETGNVSRLLWGQVAEFNNEIVILIGKSFSILLEEQDTDTCSTRLVRSSSKDVVVRIGRIHHCKDENTTIADPGHRTPSLQYPEC